MADPESSKIPRAFTPEQQAKRNAYASAWHKKNRARQTALGRAWRAAHPEKMAAFRRKYRAAHPEKFRDRHRRWVKANPDRAKDLNKKWHDANIAKTRIKKGLPEPTRPAPQVCECCGKPPGKRILALDHDHITGVFRGWLCAACNLGIGALGDDIASLRKAIAYIEESERMQLITIVAGKHRI